MPVTREEAADAVRAWIFQGDRKPLGALAKAAQGPLLAMLRALMPVLSLQEGPPQPVAAMEEMEAQGDHTSAQILSDLQDAAMERERASVPIKLHPESPILELGDLFTIEEPEWLVKDLIPRRAFVCLYGKPGSGKTFTCLGIALDVATGTMCFDRTVQQGKVIYCWGEGLPGLKLRALGWGAGHVISGLVEVVRGKFLICKEPPRIHDPAAVKELIALLKSMDPVPILLILDTLSLCMLGADENSTEDMNRACGLIKQVVREVGCTVIAVHHPGKDPTKGARGSSVLLGAVDTMLELTPDKKLLVLSSTKQRDWEPCPDIQLIQAPVDIGERTSCWIRPARGEAEVVTFSDTCQKILAYIAEDGNEEGVSNSELQAELEMGKSLVNKNLRTLKSAGRIKKIDRKRWVLNIPAN